MDQSCEAVLFADSPLAAHLQQHQKQYRKEHKHNEQHQQQQQQQQEQVQLDDAGEHSALRDELAEFGFSVESTEDEKAEEEQHSATEDNLLKSLLASAVVESRDSYAGEFSRLNAAGVDIGVERERDDECDQVPLEDLVWQLLGPLLSCDWVLPEHRFAGFHTLRSCFREIARKRENSARMEVKRPLDGVDRNGRNVSAGFATLASSALCSAGAVISFVAGRLSTGADISFATLHSTTSMSTTAVCATLLVTAALCGSVWLTMVTQDRRRLPQQQQKPEPSVEVHNFDLEPVRALVAALTSLDRALRRSIRTVREAELLSRGYRLSAPAGSALRLEQQVGPTKMLLLRRSALGTVLRMVRLLHSLCKDALGYLPPACSLADVIGAALCTVESFVGHQLEHRDLKEPPTLVVLHRVASGELALLRSLAVVCSAVVVALGSQPPILNDSFADSQHSFSNRIAQRRQLEEFNSALWEVARFAENDTKQLVLDLEASLDVSSSFNQGSSTIADTLTDKEKAFAFKAQQLSGFLEGMRLQIALAGQSNNYKHALQELAASALKSELHAAAEMWETARAQLLDGDDTEQVNLPPGFSGNLLDTETVGELSVIEPDTLNPLPSATLIFESCTGDSKEEEAALLAYRPALTRAERIARKREQHQQIQAETDERAAMQQTLSTRLEVVDELRGVLKSRYS